MRVYFGPVTELFAPKKQKVPKLPSAADDAAAEAKAAEEAKRKARAQAQAGTGRASSLLNVQSGRQSQLSTGRTSLLGSS